MDQTPAPTNQPAPQPYQPPAQQAPNATPVSAQPGSPGSGLAITSMVLGILALLTGFIFIGTLLGIVAIVLGGISLGKRLGGKSMAITGIITGAIGVLIGGLFIAITLIAYSGIQDRAREFEMRQQQMINQRQEQIDEMNSRAVDGSEL